MALDGKITSSPAPGGFKTLQEEISYYKTQYEHLESELQEFQASSRELEAELEKDVEASEKRERTLKEKVESLRFEVDEWKSKYKQSKAEASNQQNILQKEITALRDGNRTLTLKLRDIEVANDDIERQARYTTSSLEDLESKYNVALERSVMMEEEIRSTEQEREDLRIESQRLRDELSDLKIEAEITQEKLRNAEHRTGFGYKRISLASDTKSQGPQSPASGKSIATTASTNAASTPTAPKSEASTATSEAPTPPSPPISESSIAQGKPRRAPLPALATRTPPKLSPQKYDKNPTPRPGALALNRPRHTRGPSLASGPIHTPTPTPNFARRTTNMNRPVGVSQEPLPRSGSLYQIRGLIGKMQKLEERVHSARSKLPAPTNTPPRASPRSGAIVVPSTVTVRSSRKRSTDGTDTDISSTPSRSTTEGVDRRNNHTRRQSRISFGLPSHDGSTSRPTSRLSNISNSDAHFTQPTRSNMIMPRPSSRQQGTAADARRPRSSLGGRATPSHGHRPSVGTALSLTDGSEDSFATPTARRTTIERSAIPALLNRRQSRQMLPPEKRSTTTQDVGETF